MPHSPLLNCSWKVKSSVPDNDPSWVLGIISIFVFHVVFVWEDKKTPVKCIAQRKHRLIVKVVIIVAYTYFSTSVQ